MKTKPKKKFTDVEQIHKCVEECAELSVSLMHYLKPVPKPDDNVARNHVMEELADMSIMVDQLARRFGRAFEIWRESKLDRLHDRLTQGAKS